ncbi:class I SAM-dependent methyltransferase [Sphingomonas sp. RS2018]
MTGTHDWAGAVGDVWAQEWRRTDRSLADLSRHLDAAILSAAPAGALSALDIGCGAGATSLALASDRPDARIVGVDLSAGLIDAARSRAGQGGPSFETGDATMLAGKRGPFDLLYSRHGVMFFDDPVAAFRSLRASAQPGARLVFSCFRDWQHNAFARDLATALGGGAPQAGPGPFAFADRDHVAGILAAAGWSDGDATAVDFAYRAGAGADPVDDAVSFLTRIGPAASNLRTAPAADRAALIDTLRSVVARYHLGDTVDFPAAAWIWSAKA